MHTKTREVVLTVFFLLELSDNRYKTLRPLRVSTPVSLSQHLASQHPFWRLNTCHLRQICVSTLIRRLCTKKSAPCVPCGAVVVELAEGSVFLLTAPDDEDFIHTAWWNWVQKQISAQYRAAFVFRWLSKRHMFHADGAGRERFALVT